MKNKNGHLNGHLHSKREDRQDKRQCRVPGYLICCALLLTQFGCQGNPGTADQNGNAVSQGGLQGKTQGPTASEVMRQMRRAYAGASRYRDHATLQINYQLQGSFLEEPNAWQVDFHRGQGLRANVYDARIKADSSKLACFIFDFGSGNLDNQWLVQRVGEHLPIGNLLQDGICRHYLTGRDEIPVNKDLPLASHAFFPPTVGLLNGHIDQDWLLSENARRLVNEKIDGKDCHQIELTHAGLKWILHIDANDFLIRQIRYPNQLLDSRLHKSPDVKYLEIVARFSDATFSPDIQARSQSSETTDSWRVDIPTDAKTVRRFVPIPEPFPTPNVGKPVTRMGLRENGDLLLNQNEWKGKVTLLCWPGSDDRSVGLSSTVEQAAGSLSTKEYQFLRIRVFQGMLPGNPQAIGEMQRLASTSPVPVAADFGFQAGRAIGLARFPALAIIDRQGVLQYAKLFDDGDDSQFDAEMLRSVLIRVRSGDDVAGEMKQEYTSFLNLYRQRLDEVALQSDASVGETGETESKGTGRVQPVAVWSNEDLLQPGNLAATADGASTILDGWRTLVQLDTDGNRLKEKQLILADRESISVIRKGDSQPNWSVVYTTMGRTVRVLNQNLEIVKTFSINNDKQRIRTARLIDINGDGQDELLVSFSGSRGTELLNLTGQTAGLSTTSTGDEQDKISGLPKQLESTSIRAAAITMDENGDPLLIYSDANAKLRAMSMPTTGSQGEQQNQPNFELEKWEPPVITATRIVACDNPDRGTRFCVIGSDEQGQWHAFGFDGALNLNWKVPVGGQRFDTQIEPLVYVANANADSGLWAVAGDQGSVQLIQRDGQWQSRWDVGQPLRGIFAVKDRDSTNSYRILISTQNKVQAWSVQQPSDN